MRKEHRKSKRSDAAGDSDEQSRCRCREMMAANYPSASTYGAVEDPRVHDRTALLKGTIQLTNETNELAAGIGENLREQRTSLEDGSTRIREMKGFAGEARRLLNQMARRAACHRVTLWGIIVFLLVCIGLTVYRLLTNRGHII